MRVGASAIGKSVPTGLDRALTGTYSGPMTDNWRLRAKCKDMGILESDALFFPKSGRTKNQAIRFCTVGECPVIEQCLEFALENDCRGLWAGTTYKDRLAMITFRKELDGVVPKDPRKNLKKPKRTAFRMA